MRFKQFLQEQDQGAQLTLEQIQQWLAEHTALKRDHKDASLMPDGSVRINSGWIPNEKWDGTFPFKVGFFENISLDATELPFKDLSKISLGKGSNLHIIGDGFTGTDELFSKVELEFLHVMGDLKIKVWPKVSHRIYITQNDKLKSLKGLSAVNPQLDRLWVTTCRKFESFDGIPSNVREIEFDGVEITSLEGLTKQLKHCEKIKIRSDVESGGIGICALKGLKEVDLKGLSMGNDFERFGIVVKTDFLLHHKYDMIELIEYLEEIGMGSYAKI